MAVDWKGRVPLDPHPWTPVKSVHLRHLPQCHQPAIRAHDRHGKISQIGIHGGHAVARNSLNLYEQPLI